MLGEGNNKVVYILLPPLPAKDTSYPIPVECQAECQVNKFPAIDNWFE